SALAKAPLVAWTYISNERGVFSVPGTFRLPVERDGIDLAILARAPQAPAFVPVSAAEPAPLTSRREAEGMLMNIGLSRAADGRILEGTYIVALLEPGTSQPNWGLMELDHSVKGFDARSAGPLRASVLSGSTRVPFDYMVFSIQRTL
ncbi:MAG TPA: hypothetical protein VMU84_14475, partial [Thermoanaerobaculia bacterium]|nr:hypothetical protein [Thermoanaerobaculia bacterium]